MESLLRAAQYKATSRIAPFTGVHSTQTTTPTADEAPQVAVDAPASECLDPSVTATQPNNNHHPVISVGSTVEQIKERANRSLIEIILSSAQVWVPTNTLNFLFVPKAFRVVPTVMVSTGWNVYLSLATHRGEDSKGHSEQPPESVQTN